LWSVFQLLDPDPDPDCEFGSGSGSRDPVESGSNPDPDPDPQLWKKCFFKGLEKGHVKTFFLIDSNTELPEVSFEKNSGQHFYFNPVKCAPESQTR